MPRMDAKGEHGKCVLCTHLTTVHLDLAGIEKRGKQGYDSVVIECYSSHFSFCFVPQM